MADPIAPTLDPVTPTTPVTPTPEPVAPTSPPAGFVMPEPDPVSAPAPMPVATPVAPVSAPTATPAATISSTTTSTTETPAAMAEKKSAGMKFLIVGIIGLVAIILLGGAYLLWQTMNPTTAADINSTPAIVAQTATPDAMALATATPAPGTTAAPTTVPAANCFPSCNAVQLTKILDDAKNNKVFQYKETSGFETSETVTGSSTAAAPSKIVADSIYPTSNVSTAVASVVDQNSARGYIYYADKIDVDASNIKITRFASETKKCVENELVNAEKEEACAWDAKRVFLINKDLKLIELVTTAMESYTKIEVTY